ncbi:phage tail assembly chaperone [Sphingomonas sp. XXL09]|uniref:phage tail assembly chaperone n=1 Tax=Sphingomonas sp. XXL09 TaxID=3457787 RepID=UPI00406BC763
MSRFAVAATRLAGMAGVTLGWPPDVFWQATPAELAAVVRAAAGAECGGEPPDAALIARLRKEHPDG